MSSPNVKVIYILLQGCNFDKKKFDASEYTRSGYTATTARALRPTLKAISKAWLPANKIVHLLEHKNKPCLDRGA